MSIINTLKSSIKFFNNYSIVSSKNAFPKVDPSLIFSEQSRSFKNSEADKTSQKNFFFLKKAQNQKNFSLEKLNGLNLFNNPKPTKKFSLLKNTISLFTKTSASSLSSKSLGGLILESPASLVRTAKNTSKKRFYSKNIFPLAAKAQQTQSYDPTLFFLGFSLSLLAAYVLSNNDNLFPYVYAEEKDDTRLSSVDLLPPNPRIQDLKGLGLIEDPDHKGWYKLNKNNKLRVRLNDNGQLVWKSFVVISGHDVAEVASFYEKLKWKRSLHINTGIHAGEGGSASIDSKSGNFFLQDIDSFKNYDWASFHIISSVHGPITHQHKPNIDILDAWCFSESTKDFSMYSSTARVEEVKRIHENSISYREFIDCFFSLDYESQIYPTTSYVEPVRRLENKKLIGLKQEILSTLKKSSFCYVKGIGGLGKTRAAFEIEQKVKKDIEKEASKYSNVIFISLKSSNGRSDFLEHVRKGLIKRKEGEVSDEVALKNYFDILSRLAKQQDGKVLIIIDNIDTDHDLKVLKELYDSLKEFHSLSSDSPFDLLVTGRKPLDLFTTQNKLQGGITSVDLEKYSKNEDNAWKVFLVNFLEKQKPINKSVAESVIQGKKVELLKIFNKYGNHTGFTVTLAHLLGNAYSSGVFKGRFNSISKLINSAVARGNQGGAALKGNYGSLSEVVKVPLESLDEQFPLKQKVSGYSGTATPLFEILALISDGPIRYGFVSPILEKCTDAKNTSLKGADIGDIDNLVCQSFPNYSLINDTDSPDGFTFVMPQFYNVITRHNLSIQYSKHEFTKKNVDTIISIVLDVITSNLKNDQINKKEIDENITHLLSLFDYASDLENSELMYEEVCNAAAKYIEKNWKNIRYGDISDKLRKLFATIARKPGYSLDLSLHDFINNTKTESARRSLLKNLKKTGFSLPLLKQANNFYVIHGDKEIKERIDSYLTSVNQRNVSDLEKEIITIVGSNIEDGKNQENLLIFPELEFHQIPERDRLKAEAWKKEWQAKGHSQRLADLSRKELKDGLRTLVYYLLGDQLVEEVNLSGNWLGYSGYGAKAVCDLLKYPGSLKTLKLDHNYLYKNNKNFDQILEGLENNITLETLILNNNSLEDRHIEKLCHALRSHPKINRIDLHYNSLGQNSLVYLGILMAKNPNISEILLQNNYTQVKLIKRHNNRIIALTKPQSNL